MISSVSRKYGIDYIYAKIASIKANVLSRDDLVASVRADTLKDSINALAKKPLGSYVAGVYSVKGESIRALTKAIDEYTIAVIKTLYSYIDSRTYEIIRFFENIYDALNIVSMYQSLSVTGKASYTIPAGVLYLENVSVEDLGSLDELYRVLVDYSVYPKAVFVREPGLDPCMIASRLLSYIKVNAIDHPLVRKVVKIARDHVWIRLALVFGEDALKYLTHLYTITFSELASIASLRSIAELGSILNHGYYREYGSMIRDLQSITSGFDLLNILHMIHLSRVSTDLLYPPIPCSVVRLIVLLHTENLLSKLVIVSKYSGLYARELEEFISRWWVI